MSLEAMKQTIEELYNSEVNRHPMYSDGYNDALRHILEYMESGKMKREWVGLTREERDEIQERVYGAVPHHVAFHHAIEAKLKEKNT